MYVVEYHQDIPKDLAPIPKNICNTIRRAVEHRLLVDPIGYGLPLRRNLQGYRKLRVNDYRVIYRIDGQTVVILKIGHRRDVYSQVWSRILP